MFWAFCFFVFFTWDELVPFSAHVRSCKKKNIMTIFSNLKPIVFCMLYMITVQWRIWGLCLKNVTIKTDNGQQVPSQRYPCGWSSVPSSSITPSMNTPNSMARWNRQHFVPISLPLFSCLSICKNVKELDQCFFFYYFIWFKYNLSQIVPT